MLKKTPKDRVRGENILKNFENLLFIDLDT
jgi:hypothetical protein